MNKFFAAIDLKSFYSSVECVERGLDPLNENLVVADESRTEKTICLAISPSLKSFGLPGRARLFEVNERVRAINYDRKKRAPGRRFTGKSTKLSELQKHPELALDFIIAPPRMKLYLNYSRRIYEIYLRHLAPTDLFAYSIDEVFCDISSYLHHSHLSPEDFTRRLVRAVYNETGITATAGLGTNLFLAKVAMDIIAKHTQPDSSGARLGFLDERLFREKIWPHTPITDVWRIGPGIAKRLHTHQMYTMGDVARCSLIDLDKLYKVFGVNAELLIDHAWGLEPTPISAIKNYHPSSKSLSSGQVLSEPYPYPRAQTIVKEMADELALDLVAKNYETDLLVLDIFYDASSAAGAKETKRDHYGRQVPKPAHGSRRLIQKTASAKEIRTAFLSLFADLAEPSFLVRKLNLTAGNLTSPAAAAYTQLNLFEKPTPVHLEKAILKIREKYGKTAILTGSDFEPGATGRQRHTQIGGHRG